MKTVWRRTSTWLLILVVAHVAWGITRIPGRVWQRRLADIASYRDRGAADYFLGPDAETRLRGAAEVQWLLRHTPPTSAVLYRGETKGAFELASGLLAPRFLVHADRVPPGAREHLGRPLATGDAGTAVLVGRGDSLALEFR